MPIEPVIDPNDITLDFEQRHRDAMLDLVLAWGSLDGALGMLLSCVLGIPFDQGAELIGKQSSSAKLMAVSNALQTAKGGADAATFIKKQKKKFEKFSFARNRIAHSRCAGIWTKDRNFIVFAAFEKVSGNLLAVDAISIQQMHRATKWGEAMTALVIKIVDAAQKV